MGIVFELMGRRLIRLGIEDRHRALLASNDPSEIIRLSAEILELKKYL